MEGQLSLDLADQRRQNASPRWQEVLHRAQFGEQVIDTQSDVTPAITKDRKIISGLGSEAAAGNSYYGAGQTGYWHLRRTHNDKVGMPDTSVSGYLRRPGDYQAATEYGQHGPLRDDGSARRGPTYVARDQPDALLFDDDGLGTSPLGSIGGLRQGARTDPFTHRLSPTRNATDWHSDSGSEFTSAHGRYPEVQFPDSLRLPDDVKHAEVDADIDPAHESALHDIGVPTRQRLTETVTQPPLPFDQDELSRTAVVKYEPSPRAEYHPPPKTVVEPLHPEKVSTREFLGPLRRRR